MRFQIFNGKNWNVRLSNLKINERYKKIDKFVNFSNCKIPKMSEIVEFRKFVKLSKFQKLRIQ